MTAFDPEKITYFAKTDARGKELPFGIRAKDRTKHVYVIGKSGMGKSTLLENMAAQDILNGEGFAFIDPHGQSAEALLEYIPEHRIKDVLYFNPSDMAHPIAFNIMENIDSDKRFLVVSGLMSVFKKIWVDAWSARMEYILQNTLMALLEYPGATLLGVNRMLSEKAYREAVVANVQDPSVKSFWVDEFAKYNERYMQEAGDAIKNKIGQFTGNPIIRNIIGQPKSSFNIREIMDGQKIIIMNLSKGLIGEINANLLGSMLTTRIYLAAMSRADLSPREMAMMPNFYFYVDEFQSFANATFANILSEARKYKLNLTIAHQYVDQMEEDVRNAVFGNVGTTITFRVGPMDAEVLEKLFTPRFTAIDLVNLGRYQIYLSLMIDGIGSQPFSAATLSPIKMPEVSYRDVTVAKSREQFSVTRAEIEQKIHDFHAQDFSVKRERKEKSDNHTERVSDRKDEKSQSGDVGKRAPRSQALYARQDKMPLSEDVYEQQKDDLREILKNISVPAEVAKPVQEKAPAPTPVSTPRHRTVRARSETVHETRPNRSDRVSKPRTSSVEATHTRPRRLPDIQNIEQGRAHDLRSALAAIVADVPKSSESIVSIPVQKTELHPEVKPEMPLDKHKTSEAKAPASSVDIDQHVLRAKLRKKASEIATAFEDDNPLQHTITPKALEHMMRVTTSDKAPRRPKYTLNK